MHRDPGYLADTVLFALSHHLGYFEKKMLHLVMTGEDTTGEIEPASYLTGYKRL